MRPTLEFDYQAYADEQFDPKTTRLNRGNFTIPGQGQQPDYCHMPYISHIHESGNSALEMIVSCKLWRCPSCYRLKVDSEVFKYAVLLECYSLVTGDRPFRAVASMSSETVEDITLEDLRAFMRNAKDRIKRCGVHAGFKLFHPFRIKKNVQQAIRELCGVNTSSGGFWTFILQPSNIAQINSYLDTDYKSWRDLVNLSPHVHYLLFPSHQMITGDKKIFIKKLQKKDGSYTLDSVSDVVQHLRYLLTHCGLLVNTGSNDSRLQPADVFGDLHRWKPEEFLTPDEIRGIQEAVLDVLNEKRTSPYTVDDMGELCYLRDDEEEKTAEEAGYIPFKDLIAYDALTAESIDAWIKGIPDEANAAYVEYLLSEYYQKIMDTDIPQKKRRLFLEDLRNPPDSFKITTLRV